MTLNESYEMPRDRLTKIGRVFTNIVELFTHNDIVLKKKKELKLDWPMRRCVAMVGTASTPDASIRIHKKKMTQTEKKIHDRVNQLFAS
tara:strand:+ start:3420 stop:3686 length:267 start_codon:yes stop_codon:yes gene_type:complete